MTESTRYASRKWIFCLLLVSAAVGMELAGKLTPTLADFLKWVGAIYCGFNVTQKAGEWIADLLASKKETAA